MAKTNVAKIKDVDVGVESLERHAETAEELSKGYANYKVGVRWDGH